MLELYQQIVNLRESRKPQERGYHFEQLIREIQPWEFKPPVVISPKSEQLDGVYTRHGITFIIESKAKNRKLTQGDADWEDFELKIRRRHGNGIIGIFCSLYNVHDSVYEAGDRLNKEGLYNFILAGEIWDNLLQYQLDFGGLVDYMVQFVRAKNISKPPKIQDIFTWIYDKNEIHKKVTLLCQKESGLFLRRYKHKYHEQLYVKRHIDNSIQHAVNSLKPNNLRNKRLGQKEIPKQFLVIRDLSGSGKTTMSVELSLLKNDYVVVGLSANQISIDAKIDSFFERFKNYCINELKTINSPIVFIIDSLDEVSNVREKKKEIKSVFEKVQELNVYANKIDYLCFPILIIYTIRDDYYRDWESDFEGRHEILEKRKTITYFDEDEISIAIKNYNDVYNYRITNDLSKESKDILSIPINLEIFSDACEYEGDIFISEIWEGKILQSYFDRKIDDINKHFIQGVTKELYLNILSRLAYKIVELKEISFNKLVFNDLIDKEFSNLESCSEAIFNLFESEQIIIRDIEQKNSYRYRYLRFIEYLVAFYSVSYINKNDDLNCLNEFTQKIFDSGFLSMFRVFENIKHITKVQYPTLKIKIENHFQKSEAFMSKKLPVIRSNIANGKITCKEDLKMILENTFSNNPQLTWDAFFVVAAKCNKTPSKTIVDTFTLSWKSNSKSPFRWKLLIGIAKNNLLLNDQIIKAILDSNNPKEWEIYFGCIYDYDLVNKFNEGDIKTLFDKRINELLIFNHSEWSYVSKFFVIIKNNEKFIPGGNLSITKNTNNILVDVNTKTENEISEEKKNEFVKLIDELENTYFKKVKTTFPYFRTVLPTFWGNELTYFNKEFNYRFNKPFGKEKKPFFNYLVANCDNYSNFLMFLTDNIHIDCNVLGFDINKVTLFQEVYKSKYYNKALLFEYLIVKKYPKRKIDEDFLNKEIESNPTNEWGYLAKFYYSCSDSKIAKKISHNEKILCTLLSFKYNQVIGFRFNNIISVANNALSHYYQYYDLIIKSIKCYNLYETLSAKESFINKEKEFKSKSLYDHNSDDLFNEFFPELFR